MAAFVKIWRCILPAVLLFALSCDTLDDENYYKLVVISYGDAFVGTYTIDSDIYRIKQSEIEVEDNIYIYTKGLGSLTSLDVDVSGNSFSTSFLKVFLYQNEQSVGSQSASPGDNSRTIFLSYTYKAAEIGRH